MRERSGRLGEVFSHEFCIGGPRYKVQEKHEVQFLLGSAKMEDIGGLGRTRYREWAGLILIEYVM